MINVKVNGQSYEVAEGTLALDFAKQVMGDEYKKALSCQINGNNLSLPTELHDGDEVSFNTWDDADGRWTLRHTASHILAQAVKHIFPDAKFAIGPAIDNGFYYD
ncbi:MAG: threonine--tRNA ligase, partial [Clostridia bacterium]|nr:threonine--tRNA ligase [Clostridia bacterium]